ncbi:MAG: ABC transporter permease [Proteobacteria bacterium]|nr:ABC transporter permease [Pseudomonadota bacterium]
MSFDLDLILDSIPKMLMGIGLTFQLLFLSLALGTALAIILLILRISGRWYLSWPTMVYIYIFRGTPILVQIFIIYYGFPQLDFIRNNDILWPILREPFGCAIVALTLNTGAYVSEIFRGGVLGVDRGLKEAGAALGLSVTHRFIYITAPIAIRLSLPAYSNDVISLMKSTALASTITLLDMMGIARTIVAETYAPYEIFVSVMVIYLVITWAIQRTFGWIEKRMSRHVREEV